MNKILVIGSSNTDMVVKTQHFPAPGETVLGGTFYMFPGGKGANQAVAAARAGGEVTFITKTGHDLFGQTAKQGLQAEGVDTNYVFSTSDYASGIALITVDEHGENEIVVAPGANQVLDRVDLDVAEEAFKRSTFLLMQLEISLDTVGYALQKGRQYGLTIILNPAPATTIPLDWYPYLDLITPNETEAELLTGIKVYDLDSAAQACRVLLHRGVKQVIITMGARGAFYCSAHMQYLVPAISVTPIDTTAAGDVFNGALTVGLAEGLDWLEAIHWANVAAAISVTRLGAQASGPTRQEIDFLASK